MNFKATLILIIILSIIIPISILFLQREPDLQTENNRTFLYTIPEEEIISLIIEKEDDVVRFELEENIWKIFKNESSFPVNNSRWSGITFLIKEPVIQRSISSGEETVLSNYGLDNPIFTVKILLKKQNDYNNLKISFGDLSPDGTYQYARLNDNLNIYALNTSFGNALKFLIESPPFPDWVYTFDKENINEILIYKSGNLIQAYGRNIFPIENNIWKICDISIDELTGMPYTEEEPCEGNEFSEISYIEEILDLMKNPEIENIVATGLETEEDYLEYGIDKNSTYLYLRNNTFNENGSLIIRPITLSLGNFERSLNQKKKINAVFQDSKDVVQLEEKWSDNLGQLIFCQSPKINGEPDPECNF